MLKIKLTKKTFQIIIAVLIPALVIIASYFRVFETFELTTLDLRFKIRPAQKLIDDVVLIEIAEDTLEQIGEWPIDRSYYAALIDVLTLNKAKAIVFDIIFSQKSNPVSDSYFIESVKNSGKVYVPLALRQPTNKNGSIFPESDTIDNGPMPELESACHGIGHINILPDIDGKRRKSPLFVSFKGKLIPQISFLALCDYLNVPIEAVKIQKGRCIQLSPDIKIPIDSTGQTIINFAGYWGQECAHYSFIDVIASGVAVAKGEKPRIDLGEFRNKICIVGLTAVGTHDLNPIPLQERYPMVGVHINLINTILTKSFIIRVNHLINLIILVFLSLAVALAVMRLRPIFSAIVSLGVFFGFIVIAFMLFGFFNIWIDLFYPLLLVSGIYIVCTLYQYMTEQGKRLLMQKELDIAQRIQKSFLKETAPQRDSLDIGVTMVAAKFVGGDLYDFVEIDDRHLGIMIGDVSGKGVPAALFMAMTVSNFRFHTKTENEPLKVITDLNNQISTESSAGLFVTMSYIVVDDESRKLTIVDAGHLPVIYAGKTKEVSTLTATGGMALGIMDGVEFNRQQVAINSGDVFVLYTDGVTEARNTRKEEFGEERLKDAVSKYKTLPATDITKKIYEDILSFRGRAPQHDDITIIVLKIR